jgi:HAD superfamily hydrolase (TIGR01484 family)
MKYLIFLDIDGTLLARGGVPQRTRDAIARALELGHYVFINTGRAKGNLPYAMLGDLPLSGIVAGLGNYIEMNGEVLFSRAMSDDDIAYAMQIADELQFGLSIEGEDMLIDYHQERADRWPSCGKSFTSLQELKSRYPGLRVSKMGFMSPLPAPLAQSLQARFTLINHPTYAEFGSLGNNKATAMEYLMQHLGIDRDHVIAMGDSLKDVDMLRAAGIAVVMGDGHPDVKPLADFISVAAHEGGVGHALEELVLAPA